MAMTVLMSDAETADCADCAADPDLFGASWPRPVLVSPALSRFDPATGRRALRIVPDLGQGSDRDQDRDRDRDAGSPKVRADAGVGAGAGVDVARRRARRAMVRRRRRAVALATLAAGLLCGLALPLSSLAGSPVPAHLQAQPEVAGETVYVVRPGDTLWSIALRLDHGGDPRAMAEALAAETGSAVVVPGERIPIP